MKDIDLQAERAAFEAWWPDPLHDGHGLYRAPAQQEPVNAVAYLDIGAGGYMDLGTDLSDEALSALPKGRHMLVIAGTYGVDGYTAAQHQEQPQQERKPMTEQEFEVLHCKEKGYVTTGLMDIVAMVERHHGIRKD